MDWQWKGFSKLPIDPECAWGSWMAPLMACIASTDGPILEMGAGDWSTPFLHHYCACTNRELVTVEETAAWAERYLPLVSQTHLLSAASYMVAARNLGRSKPFSVALIDGSPSETRAEQCLLLKDVCTYLVVHDYSGKECIETFTAEVTDQWLYRAVAPRPQYSPSSLILGNRKIPWFSGVERCE